MPGTDAIIGPCAHADPVSKILCPPSGLIHWTVIHSTTAADTYTPADNSSTATDSTFIAAYSTTSTVDSTSATNKAPIPPQSAKKNFDRVELIDTDESQETVTGNKND